MSNFDDIFESAPQTDEFDKEAWAAKKKAERDEVYALADATAEAVASLPSSLVVGSPGMIWNARNAKKETMTMVSSISPIFLAAYFMVIASFNSV